MLLFLFYAPRKVIEILKHVKCRLSKGGHDYVLITENFIDAGMGKIRTYRCDKCGKVKRVIV
ncbi:hypothetical protein KAI37_02165 [Paenibacillus sp. S25]|nr:hypothetical protein KAI37_02165 [Paenibacillus sp. S25]